MKKTKTAVIYIKRSNGTKLVINPHDLKEVVVSMASLKAELVTSAGTLTVKLSDYAVNDRLKPMLRDRYNIIDLEEGQPIKVQDRSKAHSLVVIHSPESRTSRFIFPKALAGVVCDGSTITVRGFKQNHTVRNVSRREHDTDCFEAFAAN